MKMIEYYGWLRILDNAYESDSKELLKTIKEVETLTRKFGNNDRIFELKCINSRCILCTAGSTNHKNAYVLEIIELFKTISVIAPGTYGLLYLLDDEDDKGKDDEFQVFKISKGKMIVEKEQLLSPCSKIIFD